MKVSKIITNPKFMYNDAFDNFLKNLPARFETMGRTIRLHYTLSCNMKCLRAYVNVETYNYVVNRYCELRNINKTTEIDKLIAIKALHSIHYRRKKRFLHGLKNFVLH